MNQEFGQPVEKPKGNVLGVVGFILAFCLSPIGLIISLVALKGTPKGLAIGGVVVGLIGTIIWAAMIAGGIFFKEMFKEAFELTTDVTQIRQTVDAQQAANGSYPADLTGLGLDAEVLVDPWGRDYEYSVANSAYTLRSVGADGVADTPDDLVIDSTMSDQAAQAEIQRALNVVYQDRFGGPQSTGGTSGGAMNGADDAAETADDEIPASN